MTGCVCYRRALATAGHRNRSEKAMQAKQRAQTNSAEAQAQKKSRGQGCTSSDVAGVQGGRINVDGCQQPALGLTPHCRVGGGGRAREEACSESESHHPPEPPPHPTPPTVCCMRRRTGSGGTQSGRALPPSARSRCTGWAAAGTRTHPAGALHRRRCECARWVGWGAIWQVLLHRRWRAMAGGQVSRVMVSLRCKQACDANHTAGPPTDPASSPFHPCRPAPGLQACFTFPPFLSTLFTRRQQGVDRLPRYSQVTIHHSTHHSF